MAKRRAKPRKWHKIKTDRALPWGFFNTRTFYVHASSNYMAKVLLNRHYFNSRFTIHTISKVKRPPIIGKKID